MKHIGEIIAERQRMFVAPREKGSREWRVFDIVRGDKVNAYPVVTPRQIVRMNAARHAWRVDYSTSRRQLRLREAH